MRVRTRVNFDRLGAGVSRPGIDPRSWFAMARVDEDPDATVWDDELGWLVDVTIVGGPLDGEGPVLCRFPAPGQGHGVGEYRPPRQGCLVAVAIPGGDTNNDCLIVGQLHDSECRAAQSVNGTEITEAFAARTHIHAFPGEDLDGEFAKVRLTGDVVLGSASASQSYVRGDDYADSLSAFLDSLRTFLNAIATGSPASFVLVGTVQAAAVPLLASIEVFKAKRQQYLSTKIKGT